MKYTFLVYMLLAEHRDDFIPILGSRLRLPIQSGGTEKGLKVGIEPLPLDFNLLLKISNSINYSIIRMHIKNFSFSSINIGLEEMNVKEKR